jgi:hypothetical protein
MVRNLRLVLPTATTAFILMTVPPLLPAPMTAGISGSALASKNLNSSRSNIYRTEPTGKPKQTTGPTRATTVYGTKSNGSYQTGGGNSGTTGSFGPARATTVKSSKSNASELVGTGYSGTARSFGPAGTAIKGSRSNNSF